MTHPLAYLNPDAMVVEDLGPLARNLRRLAHYCTLRQIALRYRAHGAIDAALDAEADCETLYTKLPPEWRW
jgi:hypothetical protein